MEQRKLYFRCIIILGMALLAFNCKSKNTNGDTQPTETAKQPAAKETDKTTAAPENESIPSLDSLPAVLNRKIPFLQMDKIVTIDTLSDSAKRFYDVKFLSKAGGTETTKSIILQSDEGHSILQPYYLLYCKEENKENLNCNIRILREKERKTVYMDCPCKNSQIVARPFAVNN